jgi:hypothetical protein
MAAESQRVHCFLVSRYSRKLHISASVLLAVSLAPRGRAPTMETPPCVHATTACSRVTGMGVCV